MTGIIVLLVAVICLGVGFGVGRRYGIESEIRRQIRDRERPY